MVLGSEYLTPITAKFEEQRPLVGEVSKICESHLRAVMPVTKGIDAFVFGTRKEVIPIMPSLKEYVYADINRTISRIGTRATYNF